MDNEFDRVQKLFERYKKEKQVYADSTGVDSDYLKQIIDKLYYHMVEGSVTFKVKAVDNKISGTLTGTQSKRDKVIITTRKFDDEDMIAFLAGLQSTADAEKKRSSSE